MNDASGALSTGAAVELRMSLNIWRGRTVAIYEVIEFVLLNYIAKRADMIV